MPPLSPVKPDEASAASVASPDLSSVVPYFISARRALLCWEHVSHAKTLVRSTKDTVESQYILNARTIYIRNGCQAQLNTVRKADAFANGIRNTINEQWNSLVQRVEEAKERLEGTIELLRQTRVEDKLRASDLEEDEDSDQDEAEEAKPQCLYDFVDKTGADTCLEGISASMNSISGDIVVFENSIRALVKEAIEVRDMLDQSNRKSSDSATISKDNFLQNMNVLQNIEQQAVDMAKNLEGIVTQFDNCVKVMRHLEGGGAAARQIVQDTPVEMGLEMAMEEPLEELTDEGLRNLIGIIGKNHAKIDLVVDEIRAGLDRVQAVSDQITLHNERFKGEFQVVVKAFHLLEEVGNKLPAHITQSELHAIQWEEEILKIDNSLVELESLREHWMNFRESYDHLLVEVGRQKDFERRVTRERRDFAARLDRLMLEERDARQDFNLRHGPFLPSAICSALSFEPPQYEFAKVENTGASVPDISASVINKAIKRISSGKEKQQRK